MKMLGLCLGASTLSAVLLHSVAGKLHIADVALYPHEGNPRKKFLDALADKKWKEIERIGVTGRQFRKYVNLPSISEPEAVEYAYRFLKPPDISCRAVVSAGGETFMAYILDAYGKISKVVTGNKCASGTGEFFLQQLRRLNITLEEAKDLDMSVDPYSVSGRCSVFCKSDCTHATNKGIPKARVAAGLSKMMAGKILELLKKEERKNIMITGGASGNKMMIEYLRREIDGLIVPAEAPYFEALGAALWVADNGMLPSADMENLFKKEAAASNTHPPLADFYPQVEFKTMERAKIRQDDVCLLGLDVGSTTTKAALVRKNDHALLADVYLRTDGDPVNAARMCYRSIYNQLSESVDPDRITIEGLGVCGSGRQIAGLHALTDGIINEIQAHAVAAVYFDPEVDTIFEIGGQDAKYTYLINSVPADYAMNEACSAGTGSFLEESACESMGVKMEDIAAIALTAKNPPNFNDQCAAFISSDIKNAISEGVAPEDIIAGLVYSVCLNYSNRVKGNREIGRKIFMQGGVCYNKAVPLAMSALTGKKIIVPPEPGLMGAFGAALEIKRKIEMGLMEKKNFALRKLMDREVKFGRSFICRGGKENCDRRCAINVIDLEGGKYPFGGACNKYYNIRRNLDYDVKDLNFVALRQKMVFENYAATVESCGKKLRGAIGFNRSFFVNTYYPLYANFFAELGYEPRISGRCNQEGIDEKKSSFCYPVELAHGFFHALLTREDSPDYIFLPHFRAAPASDKSIIVQACPLVQSETFYLKSTFDGLLDRRRHQGTKLLTPCLDLSRGLEAAEKPLLETARQMGVGSDAARKSFRLALAKQEACLAEMRETGRRILQDLEGKPQQTAIVIFGRSYSSMTSEANKAIPIMIASRGYPVIPLDFLTLNNQPKKEHMYWETGQQILQAAHFVRRHPQLFGVYITNFSCGPDSFLLGYFRDIMGQKPSLTLELDSHTANAGLETRIEAFMDVILSYRQLMEKKLMPSRPVAFSPAHTTLHNGTATIVNSSGRMLSMKDSQVTMLIPSMGEPATEMIGSVFRGVGFSTFVHPPADERILNIGRAHTSGKECLPLVLTTGMLLNYINNIKRPDENVAYFMPTSSGPCRFGQYSVFMRDLIHRLQIPDVAIFSLSGEDSYLGMDGSFRLRAWWAAVVGDVLEDIRSLLLANARDPQTAVKIYKEEVVALTSEMQNGSFSNLQKQLLQSMQRLAAIPLLRPPHEVPTVVLLGEIFVRRDSLSRQNITERLAESGFATICSPVVEWLLYTDYLVEKDIVLHGLSLWEKMKFRFVQKYVALYTYRLRSRLEKSGLVLSSDINIDKVVKAAAPFVSINLTGETVLTVGSALLDVGTKACGVISIGPFGCMPCCVAEAILNTVMKKETKIALEPRNNNLKKALADFDTLPFLAIESDGLPFPQLIEAKLEAFLMQAGRLHEQMIKAQIRR